jgi:hypothetical protein
MNDDIIVEPCRFCQQDVSYAPLDSMEGLGIKVYFCYTCSAEYMYSMHFNTFNSTSIYATFNNKMYRWSMTGNAAHLWYIKTPGIPGCKENKDLDLIKTFKDNLPDITPDNFIEKLSVYLLFI